MSMHIRYMNFPTQYAEELRNKGQRNKARAFWEYCYDIEKGEYNSLRFYGQSWGISKTQAGTWIDDFKIQYDLYHDAWKLLNHYGHSSIKKTTCQSGQQEADSNNADKPNKIGVYNNTTCQSGQQEADKVLNQYDSNDSAGNNFQWFNHPEFNDLFFVYSQNTRFAGKKEEAYIQFTRTEMNPSILILSAVQYLHDPTVGGKHYNLANFLKNETYLSYIPKMIKVRHGDEEIIGEYDRINQRIIENGSNRIIVLTPERLVELFKVGALEFIKPVGRVA